MADRRSELILPQQADLQGRRRELYAIIDTQYRAKFASYDQARVRGAIEPSLIFPQWVVRNGNQIFLDAAEFKQTQALFEGSVWELLALIQARLKTRHNQLLVHPYAGHDKNGNRVIILASAA